MELEKFMQDSKWKAQSIMIEKALVQLVTYSKLSETSKVELSAKIFDCI